MDYKCHVVQAMSEPETMLELFSNIVCRIFFSEELDMDFCLAISHDYHNLQN